MENQKASKTGPWGNYFKEFLMLFLAVSLGFWVENLRQDGEDRRMETAYMSALLEELVEDSAKLVLGIQKNQIKMGGFDSLLLGLQQPLPLSDSTLHLVYYLQRRYAGSNQSVSLSERTLKQLLAVGGYRLIQNRHVASEIAHYHEGIDRLHNQGHIMITLFQFKARDMSAQLFDAGAYYGVTRETAGQLLHSHQNLKPLDGSPRDINEYANWLTAANGSFYYYGIQLENMLTRVASLMTLIESAYQLPHPKAQKENH